MGYYGLVCLILVYLVPRYVDGFILKLFFGRKFIVHNTVVVNNKNGTGKKAKANGYLVGGKTGTAHKVENGVYSDDKKIVAFTGAFPMHSPKYAFSIIIDSPKPQNFSHNMATGGWVVAPVVKKIINRIAPILKVSPLTQENIEKIHSLKKYNIRGVSNNSGI